MLYDVAEMLSPMKSLFVVNASMRPKKDEEILPNYCLSPPGEPVAPVRTLGPGRRRRNHAAVTQERSAGPEGWPPRSTL